MMFPKVKTPRDKAYLKWISTLPCLQCGKPGPSDPHHATTNGMGIKASDYETLPLCSGLGGCHRNWHDHLGKGGGLPDDQLKDIFKRLQACYPGKLKS